MAALLPSFSSRQVLLKAKMRSHCWKSLIFVQKFNFDSRKIVWFFFLCVKNSWKCCGFGLFSCWQLWFHEKNCLKNSWKCCGFVKIEFLDKNLTLRLVCLSILIDKEDIYQKNYKPLLSWWQIVTNEGEQVVPLHLVTNPHENWDEKYILTSYLHHSSIIVFNWKFFIIDQNSNHFDLRVLNWNCLF